MVLQLLGVLPVSGLIVDAHDTILYWNAAAIAFYGWRREEAVGKLSRQLLQTRPALVRRATEGGTMLARASQELISRVTRNRQRRIVHRHVVALTGHDEDGTALELSWAADAEEHSESAPPARRLPFEKLQDQVRKLKTANAVLTAENQALRIMAETAAAREQQRSLLAARAVQQSRIRLAEIFRLASSVTR
jgi:PAS domain-containing protein